MDDFIRNESMCPVKINIPLLPVSVSIHALPICTLQYILSNIWRKKKNTACMYVKMYCVKRNIF